MSTLRRSLYWNWNVLLFLLGTARFIQRVIVLFLNDRPYDILINLDGIRTFQQGLGLYVWSPSASTTPLFYSFISSPFVALILRPFAGLDDVQVTVLYRLISILLYFSGLFLLSKAARLQMRAASLAFGLFWFVALSWEPTFNSIGLGQLNELLLPCFAIAYWGWIAQKPAWAGIGGGLAAAIKLSPVLLLGYWVLRQGWKTILLALLVSGFLGLISCFYVSWGQCTTYLTTIFPAISRGSINYYNESISAFVMRSYIPKSVSDWSGLEMLPVIPEARLLLNVVNIILVGSVLIVYWKRRQHRQSIHLALEYGIALTLLLLTAPITWWHYCVWLLPAFAAILYQNTLFQLPPLRGWLVLAIMTAAILLMNLPPEGLMARALTISNNLLANFMVSLPTVGILLLLLGLIITYVSTNNHSVPAASA